jgi:hypothetical protein
MALTKIPGSLIDTASGINGLIYPTSDGTAGQFLKTDGSGNLSFASVPAGYTDSDVETYLDGGTSTPTFASATVSGALTVTGNLSVTGTTTTLETATLQVEDNNIVLNYGSGDTSAAANGAGITIQDAVDASNDATILWDATDDEFDFSHTINITNLKVSGAQGSDGQLLTSTGSGVGWEDAPASGPSTGKAIVLSMIFG